MKYKVLVINGKAGVGKSTAVECIKQINPYTLEVSMVDPAKDVMRYIGQNPFEKTPTSRAFMCDLKNLLDKYYNLSFKNLNQEITQYTDELIRYGIDTEFIVIVHAREAKDIKKLRNFYDAKTLLIESETRGINPEDASNAADADIYNSKYDFTVYNDGSIEELKAKLKVVLDKWQ